MDDKSRLNCDDGRVSDWKIEKGKSERSVKVDGPDMKKDDPLFLVQIGFEIKTQLLTSSSLDGRKITRSTQR